MLLSKWGSERRGDEKTLPPSEAGPWRLSGSARTCKISRTCRCPYRPRRVFFSKTHPKRKGRKSIPLCIEKNNLNLPVHICSHVKWIVYNNSITDTSDFGAKTQVTQKKYAGKWLPHLHYFWRKPSSLFSFGTLKQTFSGKPRFSNHLSSSCWGTSLLVAYPRDLPKKVHVPVCHSTNRNSSGAETSLFLHSWYQSENANIGCHKDTISSSCSSFRFLASVFKAGRMMADWAFI